jgi:hypothetical protein
MQKGDKLEGQKSSNSIGAKFEQLSNLRVKIKQLKFEGLKSHNYKT